MDLNKTIMESIQSTIDSTKNPTSVKFGGPSGSSIEDKNVESKNKAAADSGLKGDIAKENKNPQGESEEAMTAALKNPKLTSAVVAGIVNAGKIVPNKDVKFTPSESAS